MAYLPSFESLGFSAWSSSRDPSEIFSLLEATFSKFDKIAKQRGAYKVETVGDCYIGRCPRFDGISSRRPSRCKDLTVSSSPPNLEIAVAGLPSE